jgi:hypothetical protein
MKSIGQLLSPADILLNLDVSTKRRLFEEAGRLFEQRHGLPRTQVVGGIECARGAGLYRIRPGNRASARTRQESAATGRGFCTAQAAQTVRFARRETPCRTF